VGVCGPVVGELACEAGFEDGVQALGFSLVAVDGVGDLFGGVAVEVVCLALCGGEGGGRSLV